MLVNSEPPPANAEEAVIRDRFGVRERRARCKERSLRRMRRHRHTTVRRQASAMHKRVEREVAAERRRDRAARRLHRFREDRRRGVRIDGRQTTPATRRSAAATAAQERLYRGSTGNLIATKGVAPCEFIGYGADDLGIAPKNGICNIGLEEPEPAVTHCEHEWTDNGVRDASRG